MKPLFVSLRALYPLLGLRRWSVLLLVALGVLVAILEGFTISLLIPLAQPAGSASAGRLADWMGRLFSWVPADRRFLAIAGAILLCLVLKNVLAYSFSTYFSWLNAAINHRLRGGLLGQVLRVSQSYLDQQESGKLLHTLNHETWRACAAFSVLAGMLINVCMVLIFCVLFLAISWRLTIVTGVALVCISQITRALTWRARQWGDVASAANSTMSQRALEIFSGLRLIRTFGREPHEQQRYEAASEEVRGTFFRIDVVSGLVGPVSEILGALLLLGILAAAMREPGSLTSSLAFLLLLYRLHPRVKQLDLDRVTLSALAAPVEQVRALLEPADKPYLHSGRERLTGRSHDIVFEQVSLRYQSGNQAALDGVSLTIPAGRTTALVGPSGAGKSSVISLLCRFYDPDAGEIRLGGVPLRALDLPWWRSQLAVVSQDVHLFHASIRENIAYGKLDATLGEVAEAARRAQALDFIEALPQGFDTLVGDRGLRLSGGQRQRLALARAFIRDPQILILDEATNSLDLISEHLVQDAIAGFGAGRTIVLVAHRLSTIEQADQVIVFDAGRVVESGSLAHLRANGGLFAHLHALQFHPPAGRTAAPLSEVAIP